MFAQNGEVLRQGVSMNSAVREKLCARAAALEWLIGCHELWKKVCEGRPGARPEGQTAVSLLAHLGSSEGPPMTLPDESVNLKAANPPPHPIEHLCEVAGQRSVSCRCLLLRRTELL